MILYIPSDHIAVIQNGYKDNNGTWLIQDDLTYLFRKGNLFKKVEESALIWKFQQCDAFTTSVVKALKSQ